MTIKHQNIITITIGLTLVTVSNIIGHFAAPFSISVTPILLTIIIAGINSQLYKSNFHLTVAYNFGILLLNDLLIRLFAGGTHDQEGKAWISLYFIISFVLAFITMTIYSLTTVNNQNKTANSKKVMAPFRGLLILSIMTGLIYFYILADI
jgi:hypothetical protein